MKLKDLTGNRYGKLRVISLMPSEKGIPTRWMCKCDCGNDHPARAGNLQSGQTKSCGCARPQFDGSNKTHGQSRSREYILWSTMKARCANPNREEYSRYGGRGIRVCDRWRGPNGFENFMADMGPRPSPQHTVERNDNDGNYEPSNCTWSTRKEQHKNRIRMSYFSDEQIQAEMKRRGLHG
jgi:hypothetical protein